MFDPSELFDFLSRDDVGDLGSLNDLDWEVSIKGKSISLRLEQKLCRNYFHVRCWDDE